MSQADALARLAARLDALEAESAVSAIRRHRDPKRAAGARKV